MEASGVYVYLMFGAIGDEKRTELLRALAENLPVHMTLHERAWPPCVLCEGTSDDAASAAVQARLNAICEEIGVPTDQVTTTLDPNRL